MIEFLINNYFSIAGAILSACFVAYLTWRHWMKSRFITAADKFRSAILKELEGLYSNVTYWDESAFARARQTITKIESIAIEFRHFVPFYRKRAYDTALKNYCDYCNKITWTADAAYVMYPNMSKPGEKRPKEIFKNNVDTLLSFAKGN